MKISDDFFIKGIGGKHSDFFFNTFDKRGEFREEEFKVVAASDNLFVFEMDEVMFETIGRKGMEMIPDEIGDLVLIDFRQVFGMEFIEDIFSEGRPDAFFGRDVSVLWEDI